MAGLSELDLECLEFQTGFLSGLTLGSWGEHEQMNRYASRHAIVLALLGRTKESDYQSAVANTSALYIGRAARKAWDRQPLRRRFRSDAGARYKWEQAHTESLFLEADDHLRRIQADVDEFRVQIAHHHFVAAPAVRGA